MPGMTANTVETDGEAARQRERWVAFAFTGADLLVEATPDGVIRFAAGPFRLRFGADPESFVGRRATTLIAPPDQAAFRRRPSAWRRCSAAPARWCCI